MWQEFRRRSSPPLGRVSRCSRSWARTMLPGLSQQAAPDRQARPGLTAGHGCGHHLFGVASAMAAPGTGRTGEGRLRSRERSGSMAARPKKGAAPRRSWCDRIFSTTAIPCCTGTRKPELGWRRSEPGADCSEVSVPRHQLARGRQRRKWADPPPTRSSPQITRPSCFASTRRISPEFTMS